MTEMKSQIQEAYLMVDRRQNEAALRLIDEILAHLPPPDHWRHSPGPAHDF